MANSVFYYLNQLKTTTLATVGGIDASQTTGIKLLSVTNVDITKPGIIAIDWSNPIDTTKIEYITYTSIDGNNELVGATRGAESSTARTHDNGVTIAYTLSKSHLNEINKALDGTNGGVSLTTPVIPSIYQDSGKTKLMTLPNTASDTLSAIAATQTLTNKTLTSPLFTGTVDGWISTGTFTYASADAPTYVITVASGAASIYNVGDRIKLTDVTVKYFIVTAVADTSLTVYGGTDYALTGGAITLPYYSHQKAPLGFPINPVKWTVEFTDSTTRTQATPTQNTWYNIGTSTLSIPIGCWDVYYQVNATIYDAGGLIDISGEVTLSTGNNSETDTEMTSYIVIVAAPNSSSALQGGGGYYRRQQIALASKTSYYLNLRTLVASVDTLYFVNASGDCIIRAVCALL